MFFWNPPRPTSSTSSVFILFLILFLFWKEKYVILENNLEIGYDN
jgi:hypothetical protein